MPEEASGNQILLNQGAYGLKKKKDTGKANLDFLFNFIPNFATF